MTIYNFEGNSIDLEDHFNPIAEREITAAAPATDSVKTHHGENNLSDAQVKHLANAGCFPFGNSRFDADFM